MLSSGLTGADQESGQETNEEGTSSAHLQREARYAKDNTLKGYH